MLSVKDFKNILQLTPLVSLDFILNYNDKFLVGKRVNEPAKGFYFVPGGRILKGETLEATCHRLSFHELGIKIDLGKMKFHMNMEHIYPNCFFDESISTHYVCLSYYYQLSDLEYERLNLVEQHSEILWLNKKDLMEHNNVHENTKRYFI
jgi:colanic acid biosynthesis protein WcaH